eukprot:241898_1
MAHTLQEYNPEYIPVVFDNLFWQYMIDDRPMQLGFWDTVGSKEYDKLRILVLHPETDVCIVCYSVIDIESVNHMYSKWIPLINQYMKNCPFIVIGLKEDFRNKALVEPVLFVGEEMKRLIVVGYIITYFEWKAISKDIFNLLLSFLPVSNKLVDYKNVKHSAMKMGAKACIECSTLSKNEKIMNAFKAACNAALKRHTKSQKHNRKSCNIL